MRILALPRYSRLAASSRHRMYQFGPSFSGRGWDVDYFPLLGDRYIRYLYSNDQLPFVGIIRDYLSRVLTLLKSGSYDLVWLQQEAFPWMPYPIEGTLFQSQVPLVVDTDDAYFHRYDSHRSGLVRSMLGRKIDKVFSAAELVVAGNEYLGRRAHHAGARRVEVVPTVVDHRRYPAGEKVGDNCFRIGWIGSPGTVGYLTILRGVFRELQSEIPLRFVAIGASELDLGVDVEILPWSEATEVANLLTIDVGVMPIPDTPWERGKCGFKILQYMASGKPSVASAVGANNQIIAHGVDGFLASTHKEWVEALRTLYRNRDLRLKMGSNGRKKVEQQYCVDIAAPRLINLFEGVKSERGRNA